MLSLKNLISFSYLLLSFTLSISISGIKRKAKIRFTSAEKHRILTVRRLIFFWCPQRKHLSLRRPGTFNIFFLLQAYSCMSFSLFTPLCKKTICKISHYWNGLPFPYPCHLHVQNVAGISFSRTRSTAKIRINVQKENILASKVGLS